MLYYYWILLVAAIFVQLQDGLNQRTSVKRRPPRTSSCLRHAFFLVLVPHRLGSTNNELCTICIYPQGSWTFLNHMALLHSATLYNIIMLIQQEEFTKSKVKGDRHHT